MLAIDLVGQVLRIKTKYHRALRSVDPLLRLGFAKGGLICPKIYQTAGFHSFPQSPEHPSMPGEFELGFINVKSLSVLSSN